MALTPYPFDSQNITEAQYGALIGLAMQSGISGAHTSNHFKVTSAGTSMNLTVTSVGSNSFAVVRGHGVLMNANETVTVPAAHATLPRIDLVVLRLDYATNSITPAVRTGTAASSPSAPSPVWGVSNQYEIPLAQVLVPAAATTIPSANVTDRRAFLGSQIGAWPTTSRPTTGPALGYNTTDGRWEMSPDGASWTPIATTANQITDFGGTLPVSRGGTGATSALSGRTNLEIIVQATAPSHSEGRLWVKA